jgi:hypothetical protein
MGRTFSSSHDDELPQTQHGARIPLCWCPPTDLM